MPHPAGFRPHRACPAIGSHSAATRHARLGRAVLTVLAILSCVTAAEAASLRGTVVDQAGAAVSRAEIRLLSASRELVTTSGPDGAFSFADLPAGTYRLVVLRPGFRALPREVALAADTALEVDVVLQVSAISETVVVSAAQVEAPLSAAPPSTTVVTGADLAARQVDTLSDAFRTVPGFNVAVSGSRGALTSVFPRGGESDYTLVLLDGLRLNSFGGGFDFATLASASVDRIEIVRGPQSALYGADAIGGLVQVVTRRDGPTRGTVAVEGGSAGTALVSAAAGGRVGGWSWTAGGDGLRSDNWNGERLASGVVVENDDVSRWSGMASGGFASTRGRARAIVHRGSTERGYPGPFGSDPNGTFTGLDTVSRGWNDWLGVGASGDVALSGLRLRGSFGWTDLDSRFESPYGVSTSGTRRTDGRLQLDAPLGGRVSASAGIEALGEEARSTFVTGVAFEPVPITRGMLGAFGEVRLEGVNRYLLTAGLRVERIRRDRLEASPDPFAPRPAFDDDVVVSPNPRLAGSWFVRPPRDRNGWTRLHASAGTGIRPPDAFEIAFTDNPSLRPERSRSIDVGVEHALLGGALVLDATGFANRYDDLIVAVGRSFADASQYRTDNIANARAQGVELAAAYRAARGFELRAGYDWLDTEVLAVDGTNGTAPAPFSPGDPLIRRPRHRGWIDALVTRPRWSAFARVDARGEVADVDPTYGAFGGLVRGPGFGVVHVGAAVRAGAHVEVVARASNLLDRGYEEVVGFPAPGRALTVGVRVAASR